MRIGVVEPRVAARLLKLIADGNKYAAGVTSLGDKDVRIIIREIFQDPRNYGKVSFPTAAKSTDLRPYTKGTLVREEMELEEDLEDDEEDEEIEDLDRVLPPEATTRRGVRGRAGRARRAVTARHVRPASRPRAGGHRGLASASMTGRSSFAEPEAGPALPIFERWRRAPPPALVAARIEAHTGAGDVVADLFGRGGWVARAALDPSGARSSLESTR